MASISEIFNYLAHLTRRQPVLQKCFQSRDKFDRVLNRFYLTRDILYSTAPGVNSDGEGEDVVIEAADIWEAPYLVAEAMEREPLPRSITYTLPRGETPTAALNLLAKRGLTLK